MLVLGIEAASVERGNVVAKALAGRRDQIVERSDHAFRRVAGDVDLARLVHARRDQDHVMLLAQRVKRRILADREAQMELDAALDEPVDAAHHDLLLQLEARDAIGEEPARAVVAVIDMDLMPRGAQIFRSGQPRRTRADDADRLRSEEHTSELQSLMRISYAVFCLKNKKHTLS